MRMMLSRFTLGKFPYIVVVAVLLVLVVVQDRLVVIVDTCQPQQDLVEVLCTLVFLLL